MAVPGGWNDPDYLLLGYLSNWQGQHAPTPLTPNEQYTHVSLWCLVAAPLIFSGDITRLDDFTLSLLCNDEVIDVDQDPLGKPGRRVAKDGDLEVWAKDMEDGRRRSACSTAAKDATVRAAWSSLGIAGQEGGSRFVAAKGLGDVRRPILNHGPAARSGPRPYSAHRLSSNLASRLGSMDYGLAEDPFARHPLRPFPFVAIMPNIL